jgi:hypothetical protein
MLTMRWVLQEFYFLFFLWLTEEGRGERIDKEKPDKRSAALRQRRRPAKKKKNSKE